MATRQTTEQEQAKSAWGNIEKVPVSIQKEYGSLARGLPALIQTNGLGQALAFLCAKGKNDPAKQHSVIYKHLSDWVCSRMPQEKKPVNLLEWIITQNSGMYRRATREALAYALWLRRFAEAKGWGGEEGIGHE